jgi:hypothetical protein
MFTIATNDPYLLIEIDRYNGHSRETRAGIRQCLRRDLITESIVYRYDGGLSDLYRSGRNPGVSCERLAKHYKKLASGE